MDPVFWHLVFLRPARGAAFIAGLLGLTLPWQTACTKLAQNISAWKDFAEFLHASCPPQVLLKWHGLGSSGGRAEGWLEAAGKVRHLLSHSKGTFAVSLLLFVPFVGFSLLAGFIDEHYLVPYAYLQVFVCDWAAKVLCKCCKIAHFLG